MSSMHFLDLNFALEIAKFPTNYTEQQKTAALIYLANVVKNTINNNEKQDETSIEHYKCHHTIPFGNKISFTCK